MTIVFCRVFVVGTDSLWNTFEVWTPVRVQHLRAAIQGYRDEAFIMDGFTYGFRLGVGDDSGLVRTRPRLRPAQASLTAKISDEVAKGRVLGPFAVPPIPNLKVSPVYAIPKPDSVKIRMICDLSFPEGGSVNDCIAEDLKSVTYCSVREVGVYLQLNHAGHTAYLAKVDLADAYRIVPIAKADWCYLGLQAGDQIYVDRMLPMGAASSCQLFQRVSDALRWMLCRRVSSGVRVFNYLDDFLFISDSEEGCTEALLAFEQLCAEVGVPIAHHKTSRACTSLVFLGVGLDTVDMAMFVPEAKVLKYREMLLHFLSVSAPRVKQWQKVAGSLGSVAQVIPAGRVYIGSLYQSIAGILSQHHHRRRRISAIVRADLGVWLDFLTDVVPGRHFKMLTDAESVWPPIFSDASTTIGFGATFGDEWFYGAWPGDCGRGRNIAVLELYPIAVALFLWASDLRDGFVDVYTDNEALVYVLNSLYSKDNDLRAMLRPIARLSLKNNISVRARHIPGVNNVAPDLLSRGRVEGFRVAFPHMSGTPTAIPQPLLPGSLLP